MIEEENGIQCSECELFFETLRLRGRARWLVLFQRRGGNREAGASENRQQSCGSNFSREVGNARSGKHEAIVPVAALLAFEIEIFARVDNFLVLHDFVLTGKRRAVGRTTCRSHDSRDCPDEMKT